MFDINLAIQSLTQDGESSIPFIILTIVLLAFVYYKSNKHLVSEGASIPGSKLNTAIFRFFYKHSVKIAYIASILLILDMKYDNLISVTKPMSELAGVKQRIAIFEKLYAYKRSVPDYLGEPGRHKGGFMNYAFEWYKKPTPKETDYLKEYLTKVFTVYDDLLKNNKICRKNYGLSDSLFGNNDLKEALDIIRPVSYMIKLSSVGHKDLDVKVDELILLTLEYHFACPENKQLTNKNSKSATKNL